MFVPIPVPQQWPARVPRGVLTAAAVLAALALWAVLSFGTSSNEGREAPSFPAVDPYALNAVAFLESAGPVDRLVLRDADDFTRQRTVASFERIGDSAARGAIGPSGAFAAVVHASPSAGAHLSIVELGSGTVRTSPALVEPSSPVTWSPSGGSIVAVAAAKPDATGRRNASLVEINTFSTEPRVLAHFPNHYQLAPVGFSASGDGVLTVVVDETGSSLWEVTGTEARLVASLSPGRTRDWALSPDGSTLAFIEMRTGATNPAVGRAVLTSTGAAVPLDSVDEAQEGVSWRPGTGMPGFGGPGGTLSVSGVTEGSYLLPASWSPTGQALVARVVVPVGEGETSLVRWELLRPDADLPGADTVGRQLLFESAAEATFIGWALTDFASSSSITNGATPWR